MDFSKSLGDIPAGPFASDQRGSELPMLNDEERQKVLFEFNNTTEEYPVSKRIHEFFEEQTAKTPDAIALIYNSQEISYAELNQRSNRLAHYLTERGVQAETLVGIFLARTPELLVAILGVLKAGGAYVPLDPKYPKDRLQNIVDDSKMPLVLTAHALRETLPDISARVICLESESRAIDAQESFNPKLGCGPDNLAYVLFTSGSTGRPKGVAIEHRNTVTFIEWCIRKFTSEELAGAAFGTSVCFDMSTLEMFVTLAAGGRIVLLENLLDLASHPAKDQVTCINTVPSAMSELVRARSVPKSVKLVLLAGEALAHALAQDILEHTSVTRLFNLYGPTETGYSTFELVAKDRPITIGRPLSNLKAYILDVKQRPVPIGVIGEVYIGGSGVARGYFNQPQMTAQRFLPDPFVNQPGARMYKTGDIGRFLDDGRIDYRGRLDDQVKIRGFRIELGEVEIAATTFPGVREAVAAACEGDGGSKQLVLYVTAHHAVNTRELKSTLKRKLPSYMVPQFIVQVSELPRNVNGKIDRTKLSCPRPDGSDCETQYVAPTTALEQKLVMICQRILGKQTIGIEDNLFDLGLDSLSAARLCGKITRDMKRMVTPAWLFEAQTIQRLAELVDSDSKPRTARCLVTIQDRGSSPPIFGIHNGFGLVMWLHVLARNLGPDQPVYGLQPRGRYGDAEPLTSVEDMAELYLSEIRTVQPHGPYHLFGLCFGMVVAFEIAQRMRADGEEVALLAGVNGVLPGFSPFQPGSRTGKGGSPVALARNALKWRWAAFQNRAQARVRRFCLSREWIVPEIVNRHYFNSLHEGAECRYRAKPYDGDILVLCSYSQMTPVSLGWTNVCRKVEAHRVPGEGLFDRVLVSALTKGYMANKNMDVVSTDVNLIPEARG